MDRKHKIALKIIAVAIIAGYAMAVIITMPPHLDKNKIVRIPENASATQIAELLEERGVIKRSGWFLYWTDQYGVQENLQAGVYEFPSGRTPLKKVIDKVMRGEVATVRVSIPEGYTNAEIADLLDRQGLADREEFLQYAGDEELEGFLFPDTYIFPYNVSVEAIVNSMTRRFRNVFSQLCGEDVTEENFDRVKEITTLASILEKEAIFLDEKRIIADILYRRMEKNMLLQSCATVIYALGTPKPRLSLQDLRIDSPYNTYINRGLPPAPICNPGRESLEAAINPTKNEYLFFLARGNGRNHFSRTYSEHNQAKDIFLNNRAGTDKEEEPVFIPDI